MTKTPYEMLCDLMGRPGEGSVTTIRLEHDPVTGTFHAQEYCKQPAYYVENDGTMGEEWHRRIEPPPTVVWAVSGSSLDEVIRKAWEQRIDDPV